MATTFVDYTGDGNATKSFSFPSIKEADIKVDVDGVIKTSGNHYNITSYTTTGGGNVVFTSGNIPASPASIRILFDEVCGIWLVPPEPLLSIKTTLPPPVVV